ncbi:hypothetical protein CR513_13082, partial [Mucuna pruriens]
MRAFTPIPMTYTELLTHLIQNSLVVPFPSKPLQPPYLKNYDPNAKCDYHAGTIGHTTERCWGLKHKVQDLIDVRLMSFEDKGPNIGSNSLPNHRDTSSSFLPSLLPFISKAPCLCICGPCTSISKDSMPIQLRLHSTSLSIRLCVTFNSNLALRHFHFPFSSMPPPIPILTPCRF